MVIAKQPQMAASALSRRHMLKQLASGTVALGVAGPSLLTGCAAPSEKVTAKGSAKPQENAVSSPMPALMPALKGRVRHAVARWTYPHLSIDELCQLVKRLGVSAIDLAGPSDWPTLKKYGIDCSMCHGAELNLVDGWCNPEFHPQLIERYRTHIDLVADAGFTNLICFSGNARGMSKETALNHATLGLGQILPQAERRGVVLQMELFNSKVDHPDYLADSTGFGIELCQRLQSNNFKLLYDIYHMQIMEGDIIRTIQTHHPFFGHYHTAGVPGRHEIDNTQELNYPAIVKAIVASGFSGYLAQEFIPTPTTAEGKERSLADAIRICDV